MYYQLFIFKLRYTYSIWAYDLLIRYLLIVYNVKQFAIFKFINYNIFLTHLCITSHHGHRSNTSRYRPIPICLIANTHILDN